MSKVMVGGECICQCHAPSSSNLSKVVHCMPCCDGKCDICHRYISRGFMEQHKQTEHGIQITKEQ